MSYSLFAKRSMTDPAERDRSPMHRLHCRPYVDWMYWAALLSCVVLIIALGAAGVAQLSGQSDFQSEAGLLLIPLLALYLRAWILLRSHAFTCVSRPY
jgi:hypothetical protein